MSLMDIEITRWRFQHNRPYQTDVELTEFRKFIGLGWQLGYGDEQLTAEELGGVVCSFGIGVLCQAFPHLLPQLQPARISEPYPCGCCILLPCTKPTLCYHTRLLADYNSARSLKARIFPGVESVSTAIADGIDAPVCFVGPNERFESR